MITIDNPSNIHYVIVQIGVGGTGSYIVRDLSQLSSLAPAGITYVLADPDVIEEKNLKNQLFIEPNVDRKKSEVLAERYASNYDIDICIPENTSLDYVQTVEDIENLFLTGVQRVEEYDKSIVKVMIGSVDNLYTRKVMYQYFKKTADCIYIDVGNQEVKYLNEDDYSIEELAEMSELIREVGKGKENPESGWQGQVIVGMNFSGVTIQDSFGDVFPNELENPKDNPKELSCQDVAASNPQRIRTNQLAAQCVISVLSPLLFEGGVIHEKLFFDAHRFLVRPIDSE